MKKQLSKAMWTLCVIVIASMCGKAQVSPTVPNTTKDHSKQVIGYIKDLRLIVLLFTVLDNLHR